MSKKIGPAFIFPGQGIRSQELIAFHSKLSAINEDSTREALGLAQDTLNEVFGYKAFSISLTLKDEVSPNYQQTAFIQPVIYTLSMVSLDAVNKSIKPSFCAGHSLGEYSALTAANVISLEQGIQIVAHRGKLMQVACEEIKTRLVSINGLSLETVQGVFKEGELLEIALINAPDLIVVGCLKESVQEVEKTARENGAKRTIVLDTQGAFHTNYMVTAISNLAEVLSRFEFNHPNVPVIANLTGDVIRDGGILKEYLVKGMTHSVQWAKTIATFREEGVDDFYETGPGDSLAILNKRNGIPREHTRNILEQLALPS